MNTFICYVNSFSSSLDYHQYPLGYNIENYTLKLREYINDGVLAKRGDKVFYVMLHYWDKGICACGDITYVRRKEKPYYAWVTMKVMLHPKENSILPLKDVQSIMPDFDWLNASNGTLLSAEYSEKLESIWNKHIVDNKIKIDKGQT